ncbi:hypothetical protein BSKO_12952 [Bryopsis sp. KO-2023]|nr:hypothetical protein BSKO_12952 [Bryopsis sp. KO-2023]
MMDDGKKMSGQRRKLPSLGSNEIERLSQPERKSVDERRSSRASADSHAILQFGESAHGGVESDAGGANNERKSNEDQNDGRVRAAATKESFEKRKHSHRSKDRTKKHKRRQHERKNASNEEEIRSENQQPLDNGVVRGVSITEESEIPDQSAERKKPTEASADVSIRIGPTYRYDEYTGLLSPPGEGDGILMKSSKMFVENAKTGLFRRVEESKWNDHNATSKKTQTAVKPGRVPLSSMADSSAQGAQKMAVFIQGLLGGWSVLNIFLIHVWGTTRVGSDMDSFLKYYAPVALTVNRVYSGLISVALVLSFSSYSHSHIQAGHSSTAKQKRWDGLVILLYLVAYTSSVLCTPLEDEIQHLAGEVTSFESHAFHGGPFSELGVWNAMSITRMISSLLAWIMVRFNIHFQYYLKMVF